MEWSRVFFGVEFEISFGVEFGVFFETKDKIPS
jgi:hypothetical protein